MKRTNATVKFGTPRNGFQMIWVITPDGMFCLGSGNDNLKVEDGQEVTVEYDPQDQFATLV